MTYHATHVRPPEVKAAMPRHPAIRSLHRQRFDYRRLPAANAEEVVVGGGGQWHQSLDRMRRRPRRRRRRRRRGKGGDGLDDGIPRSLPATPERDGIQQSISRIDFLLRQYDARRPRRRNRGIIISGSPAAATMEEEGGGLADDIPPPSAPHDVDVVVVIVVDDDVDPLHDVIF